MKHNRQEPVHPSSHSGSGLDLRWGKKLKMQSQLEAISNVLNLTAFRANALHTSKAELKMLGLKRWIDYYMTRWWLDGQI